MCKRVITFACIDAQVPEGREVHRAKLLKELRKNGVTARNLHGEAYTLPELVEAGFSLKELMAIGQYGVEQLYKAGVRKGVKESGIGLPKLREAGFTLRELRQSGFTSKQLKDQCEAKLPE